MLSRNTILLFLFSCLTLMSQAQQAPIGTWKTVDDNTGEAKSHVEIYEQDGVLFGKIVALLLKPEDTICGECKGADKDQPVKGMVIIKNLVSYKAYWHGGTIMDPENGKVYKCKIYAEGNNKLKVRGYIGIEALGRNQYWERIK